MARNKKNCYELPEELMFKIFVVLPVVSLLRCKSVCKTWVSIISDLQFIQTHCIESKKRQPCSVIQVAKEQLYIDNHETASLLRLPQHFSGMPCFVSCCNGLVCIANKSCHVIFLWNPMTRQFKKLPTPQKRAVVYLYQVGFGFDDVSHDYKIVRIVFKWMPSSNSSANCDHFGFIEAELYSSNEDSWKEIEVPKILKNFEFIKRDVGVLGPNQTRVLYFKGDYNLLTFDLHDQVFNEYPYPIPVNCINYFTEEKLKMSSLLDFEGSVAMIYDESSGQGETVLSLWTLDVDCSNATWTKQFNLEDHLKNHHVALYLGDGQFVVAESPDFPESIFCYYKKEHAKRLLGTPPATKLFSVVKYTESLVSLEGFEPLEYNVETADSSI